MKLLHVSDVHLQLPAWRKRGLRELGPLRALATVELWKGRGKLYDDASDTLRRLLATPADHVICTGDFTQLGHDEEFALAAEVFAGVRDRLIAIPGNHDRYPLAGRPSRLYEQHFGEVEPVRLLGEDVAVLTVDSCGALCWPVISPGRVSDAGLEALEANLRAHAGRCRLVLVHHSPLDHGGERPARELRGARRLLQVCADNGADAILCGHLHERFDVPAGPGRPRVICAGSSTERGHEGGWLIEIEARAIARAARL